MIGAKELKECSKDLTVLYVEDDVRLREDMARLLRTFFKSVDTAENGQEGFDKFRKGSYDIVISDLNMPVMDGVEMVRSINSYDDDQAIVITSAHDDSGRLIELINYGVDKFLLKPIDVKKFIVTLYRVSKAISDEKEVGRFYQMLEQRVLEETEKRRQSEQMLLQKGRLAAMGELLAAIAHQWRQPLNNLALILQDIVEAYKNSEFNERYARRVVSEGMDQINFMAKTIEDFSSFLKPSRQKTIFNIHDALQNTLNLLSKKLKHDNIDISITGAADVYTVGYPNEFKQVIINILQNASDIMNERNVSHRKIDISVSVAEGKVITEIADTGGGIDKSIIAKIFDPYFTTKTDDRGTGIGLYMSKTIIEKNMDGKLTARNDKAGAVFTIELKLAEDSLQHG